MLPLIMAAPLSVSTKEEQRSVIRFLWSEGVQGATIYQTLLAQLSQWSVCEWIKKFKIVAQMLHMTKEPDDRLRPSLSMHITWFCLTDK